MKGRHFLPICEPSFFCYNHYACADGIVRANAKDCFSSLLCVKYINCVYREEETRHQFIISMFDAWWTHQGVMQNQQINFLKETLRKTEVDLLLMIKKCLLSDSYVFSCCSRKYLLSDADEEHEFFYFVLTGFDDEKREFTIWGEPNLESFACYQIGYDDFVDAMFNNSNRNINLTLWKFNQDATLELDLPNLVIELKDYINSSNSRQHYTADKLYGFQAIEALARKLETDLESLGAEVGGSYLHKFYVHKKFMKERVEYLVEQGKVDEKWIFEAERVLQIADSVKKMGLVCLKMQDYSSTMSLADAMRQTIAIEQRYLPGLLLEVIEAMKD